MNDEWSEKQRIKQTRRIRYGIEKGIYSGIVKIQWIRDNERFSTTPDVIRQVFNGQNPESEAEKAGVLMHGCLD